MKFMRENERRVKEGGREGGGEGGKEEEEEVVGI
jgi:hypothetical protein